MLWHIKTKLCYGNSFMCQNAKELRSLWTYFSFICYPSHTDSHRNFTLDILMYFYFTDTNKKNKITVTYFLKFSGYFLETYVLLTSLRHLFLFKLHVLWHIGHEDLVLCKLTICQNTKRTQVPMNLFLISLAFCRCVKVTIATSKKGMMTAYHC